ncbi:MAG TPA: hypothetical protein VF306_00255, partial [Pirellulales bacterium]
LGAGFGAEVWSWLLVAGRGRRWLTRPLSFAGVLTGRLAADCEGGNTNSPSTGARSPSMGAGIDGTISGSGGQVGQSAGHIRQHVG